MSSVSELAHEVERWADRFDESQASVRQLLGDLEAAERELALSLEGSTALNVRRGAFDISEAQAALALAQAALASGSANLRRYVRTLLDT